MSKSLFIRYPGRPWILFDLDNPTSQHQKKGLEMLIESGQDNLHVSIPHSIGGQFMVDYEKIVTKSACGQSDNVEDIVLYYYINAGLQTVQMMYATPEYIAYINRLTT
jgi:hypothetical protein